MKATPWSQRPTWSTITPSSTGTWSGTSDGWTCPATCRVSFSPRTTATSTPRSDTPEKHRHENYLTFRSWFIIKWAWLWSLYSYVDYQLNVSLTNLLTKQMTNEKTNVQTNFHFILKGLKGNSQIGNFFCRDFYSLTEPPFVFALVRSLVTGCQRTANTCWFRSCGTTWSCTRTRSSLSTSCGTHTVSQSSLSQNCLIFSRWFGYWLSEKSWLLLEQV